MLVSLVMAASLMAGQAAPAAPATGSTLPTNFPVLAPAVLSPDCGGFAQVPAFCVTSRMDQMSGLGDAYMEHLAAQGWIAADGDDNIVVFIKRRENGGCDGLQMVAFYDTTKPQTAEAPAFLGFAYIPGNLCTEQGGSDQ